MAERHALAFVIDDVHWADTTTVELLDYLLTPGHALKAPLVLACRSEEPVTAIVSGWLDRLQRTPGSIAWTWHS